jgi:hypothetical protein
VLVAKGKHGIAPVAYRNDFVPFLAEISADCVKNVLFVVGNQDFARHGNCYPLVSQFPAPAQRAKAGR